jgi:RecA-family ATPase
MNNEVNKQAKEVENTAQKDHVLTVRTAKQRITEALSLPKMDMILGSFWFTGDTCFFFAGTGIGKSIFAIQIANAITKGYKFIFDKLEVEVAPQKVIFIDFELNEMQFLKRYSSKEEVKTVYDFSDNLITCFPNKLYNGNIEQYANQVIEQIENIIISENAKILIIDNLTAFNLSAPETAKLAIEVMQKFKALKQKYDLSILVLTHTPKRDKYKPIEITDMAGSANLGNFIDSCFAIAPSAKGEKLRYIKQLKNRSDEKEFGEHNVITCEVVQENNFLQLKYITTEKEYNHLIVDKNEINDAKTQEVIDLYNSGEKAYRKIGEKVGMSHTKVGKILKNNKGK